MLPRTAGEESRELRRLPRQNCRVEHQLSSAVEGCRNSRRSGRASTCGDAAFLRLDCLNGCSTSRTDRGRPHQALDIVVRYTLLKRVIVAGTESRMLRSFRISSVRDVGAAAIPDEPFEDGHGIVSSAAEVSRRAPGQKCWRTRSVAVCAVQTVKRFSGESSERAASSIAQRPRAAELIRRRGEFHVSVLPCV